MKFPWPPSEQNGWILQTEKTKEKDFYFPMMSEQNLLLALRVHTQEVLEHFDIRLINDMAFSVKAEPNVWVQLPYPIEFHAIGGFWKYFQIPCKEYSVEFAYFPWKTRHFRMRALVNREGKLLAGYRVNKNGQIVAYFPPKDDTMLLPEDTYIVPPTNEINTKSILLVSAQSRILIKKLPEGRYFHLQNEL
jgi:hypothetical protein